MSRQAGSHLVSAIDQSSRSLAFKLTSKDHRHVVFQEIVLVTVDAKARGPRLDILLSLQ